MSILAGPRRKQRISIDPQNLNWSKDESKFGKKLMEKMGWESGKGLGKSGNGRTDNLKLKANTTGKGLGELASYDSTWIAHHDDFADLLSALNKNKPADEDKPADAEEKVRKISLELSSRSLKRRIHYQKFTRAKDIAGYDDNAKKAVLGLGLTTRKNEEKTASGSSGDEQEKPTNEQTEEAIAAAESVKKLHTVSTVSVGDYFKDKMAARLAALKSASAATRSIKVEVEDTAEDYDESAYTKVEESEDYDEPVNTEEDIVEEPRKKKKKSKKRDMDEAEESHEVEIKQEPEVEHKPKEKKRKRKHRDVDDEEPVVTNDVEEVPAEEVSEKRKKKKKRRDVEVVEYVEEVVEEYTESSTLVISEVQSEDIAPVAEEGDETENLERRKKKKKKDKKNKRRNDEEEAEL